MCDPDTGASWCQEQYASSSNMLRGALEGSSSWIGSALVGALVAFASIKIANR
jgi:hypothetical protein